jgi:hypothetical protein
MLQFWNTKHNITLVSVPMISEPSVCYATGKDAYDFNYTPSVEVSLTS